MSLRRLVLITRQFWPLIGGAQKVAEHLAHEFTDRGVEVTVLTARWQADWPELLDHRGVRVVRLPQPRWRFWGTLRYMRAIKQWLQKHPAQYDAVYVSMLKHDAYAAIGAVDLRRVPVVLRSEGTGETGDVRWQQSTALGHRIARRCRDASAIVAIAPTADLELQHAGYPPERIHTIPNGVPIPAEKGRTRRDAVRRELAEAGPELKLSSTNQLVLYAGRLHPGKGLLTLLAAWRDVIVRCPHARLWIAGDGPQRDDLRNEVAAMGFGKSVRLVGQFDSTADFLLAADVFVLPSYEELMSMSLLEAMAAGLPIVASDIEGNRHLITAGQHGLLSPPGDAESLAGQLIRLIDDRQTAEQFGAAARRRASEHFSLANMADKHLKLFERLLP